MTIESIRQAIGGVFRLLDIETKVTLADYNTYLQRANMALFDRAIQEWEKSQIITDLLYPFKVKADLTFAAGVADRPADYARFSAAYYDDGATTVSVEEVTDAELSDRIKNAITEPTAAYPIICFYNEKINILPVSITTGVDLLYLKKPATPVYAVTDAAGGVNVYDAGSSTELDWSSIYHIEIIKLILGYLGIDPEEINKIKR